MDKTFRNTDVTSVTIYEVKGDIDCEGRGPPYVVGYFTSRTIADQAAVGKGAMGSRGYVTPVSALRLDFTDGSSKFVLNNPIEVKTITKEDLRKQALSKLKNSLTEEEIKVLDIKV